MRCHWLIAVPLGLLALAAGCHNASSLLPQPGDTVAPRLVRDVQWDPGEPADVWVELAATNGRGARRRLGFDASQGKNPVAEARFYDVAGEVISTQEVELSHRC